MLEKINSLQQLQVLQNFAAGDGGIHISLKPEPIFHIGDLVVTNAIIYGVLAAVLMGFVLYTLARRSRVKPVKGATSVLEVLIEFVVNTLEGTFGSRKKAYKYTPIFGTFFLFVIFNNLMGLLPVVGPSITVGETPIFRPFTADLNGTIAMSLFAIGYVQYLSIKEQGFKNHLQHYFTDKPFSPINFFVGVIEVVGELTRVLSLSLRLFLNTAVGEILIAVFTSLVLSGGRTPLAAIPIFMFEVLVAGIQAYVFTVLTATYLSLAISHAHDDEHHDEAIKVEELPDVA